MDEKTKNTEEVKQDSKEKKEESQPKADGHIAQEEEKKEEKKSPEAEVEVKKSSEKERPKAKEEKKPEAGGQKPAEKKEVKEEVEAPKIEISAKAAEVIKTVEKMSVLELSKLVKALEERFGVSAAAPVAASPAGASAASQEGQQEEEKTSFDVVLTGIGDKKIQVIKEVRAVTSLGLKEAKDLVEQAPKPIKEGVSKEEAAEIKKKVEAVGATVEIK